eukprot:1054763_1
MLDKDPKSRISIDQCMNHTWVTEGGSKFLEFETEPTVSLSEQDVENAVTEFYDFSDIVKLRGSFRRLRKSIRANRSEALNIAAAFQTEDSQKSDHDTSDSEFDGELIPSRIDLHRSSV